MGILRSGFLGLFLFSNLAIAEGNLFCACIMGIGQEEEARASCQRKFNAPGARGCLVKSFIRKEERIKDYCDQAKAAQHRAFALYSNAKRIFRRQDLGFLSVHADHSWADRMKCHVDPLLEAIALGTAKGRDYTILDVGCGGFNPDNRKVWREDLTRVKAALEKNLKCPFVVTITANQTYSVGFSDDTLTPLSATFQCRENKVEALPYDVSDFPCNRRMTDSTFCTEVRWPAMLCHERGIQRHMRCCLSDKPVKERFNSRWELVRDENASCENTPRCSNVLGTHCGTWEANVAGCVADDTGKALPIYCVVNPKRPDSWYIWSLKPQPKKGEPFRP